MTDRLLGHDLDGQRVAYWSQLSVWTDRTEHFIEAGRFQMRLDHLEPGLLDAIQASLVAPAKDVAA
jgi:hypothetical protein